ncbi:hypothetical protein AXX12_14900 [Anaerosporomusa subterranea]|uniref:Leucine-binding protein domain-containing protein n=1 Tax=Anaerosporomusa subterranea TaxID=1794912 RepID=A0A154BMX4_ANASB|nr:ABC transporter substrate-binding protein [Anaerosporomusa subterranea]KYZ74868.1 hypothetical protein AXX12_14900 [Anaerosporomusa subterranea]
MPNTKLKLSFVVSILALLLIFVTGCSKQETKAEKKGEEDFYIGVSAPFTGDNAEYGAQWKRGFEIALEEINSKGGIKGKQLKLIFEDSQSDPKQAVNIAQKFTKDNRILATLGDFTTPATWAASPVYQSAGLVQLAVTPSHVELTKPGDYIFQLNATDYDRSRWLVEVAVNRFHPKKVALLYLNNDYGKGGRDNIKDLFAKKNVEIVASETYLGTDKDFKAQITNIKAANPDLIALVSYYTDAAAIAKQTRDLGINVPFVALPSVHNPSLLSLGGSSVEGLTTLALFNLEKPSPVLKNFIEKHKAKFGGKDVDSFTVLAYDAVKLLANAIEQSDGSRKSIRDALAKTKDFPGASQEKITYSDKRQLENVVLYPIIVKDGKFVPVPALTN